MKGFQNVTDVLDALEVKYQVATTGNGDFIARSGWVTEHGQHFSLHVMTEQEHLLVMLGHPSCRVPPGAAGEGLKLINLLNQRMAVGYFVLDNDSDVVFKITNVFDDAVEGPVREGIAAARQAIDVAVPALNSIIYANDTAEEALARVLP